MEQLYSSVVIAKDTSSMILPGALECASAGEPPAPAPARGRGGQRRTDAATVAQFLSVFDLLMTLRTPYKQPYFFRKRSLKGCVFVVKIVHI